MTKNKVEKMIFPFLGKCHFECDIRKRKIFHFEWDGGSNKLAIYKLKNIPANLFEERSSAISEERFPICLGM